MLRALLELSRVSNLPTVWTNVLAAWIIASGADWRWTPALGWLLLGASLIYSAGMILNDACDAAWDRENRQERPIPSGRIGLKTVWVIGLLGLLSGYVLMVFAGGASWTITALLVAAIVAYDAYHKPWAGSVVIMGACRTLLYLAAGSAMFADAKLTLVLSWVLCMTGGALGLYVVGLSLVARAEGDARPRSPTGLGGLVAILAPLIIGGSLCASTVGSGPASYEWFVFLPCLVFAVWSIRALARMKKGGSAIGQAVGLLLAGIPLIDAMFIATTSPNTALCFCALPPFLRLWQRWIAAT